MAVFSGPEIVNNGLVFYYDVSNTQRSWKGKPTTNLAPYTNYSNKTYYTLYDIGGWGGDDADVYYYPDSGWNDLPYKKMVKHTGGSGGSYIDEHSFFTLEEGKTYTISCYMKANKPVTVSGHALALNRNSDNQYRVPADFNLTTEWVKQQWTYICGVGEGGTTYHFRQIIYNDTNLPVEVYWCALQIEEGTYSTPYVNGTRSNTQAILDLTGISTVTATSLSYHANNTFTFDGANNYIEISKTRTGLGITNTYSLEAVFRRSSNLAGKIILGGQGYNWGIMTTTNGCRAEHWYSSNGGTTWNYFTTGDAVAPINTWTHVVATFNHLGNMCTYINGRLVITANMSAYTNNWMNTPICIGGYNYFDYRFNGLIPLAKVYNRELTANEISQNFEAVRGRYGI